MKYKILLYVVVHRKSIQDNISRAMSKAAVFDLHWEVKVNALEYWRQVIESQLRNQGMMDGVFPAVIFSKEYKKIVKLDEMKIKNILYKALDELAQQHCLGVWHMKNNLLSCDEME